MKCFLFISALFLSFAAAAHPGRTNLLFILTDNHGAWTLGCYGNKEIHTPNIDRLAREGMLFTRAYCNNSVCSPSRATFLTGLLPSQHGVHVYIPDAAQIGPKAYDVIKEFRTLPKILYESGYACGLSGKWHVEANLAICISFKQQLDAFFAKFADPKYNIWKSGLSKGTDILKVNE